MPEDCNCIIGFADFETQVGRTTVNIANEAAVLAASVRLFNETAAIARAGHLDTAREAVQKAAIRKAGLDGDQSHDVDVSGGSDEGSDFFL